MKKFKALSIILSTIITLRTSKGINYIVFANPPLEANTENVAIVSGLVNELKQSIKDDNLANFKEIIERERIDIDDIKFENDVSLLHEAVNKKSFQIFNYLIESGITVDKKDINGQTPLHYAVKNKDSELIELLILNGANICERDTHGQTPLQYVEGNEGINILTEVLSLNEMNFDSMCFFVFEDASNRKKLLAF